MDEPILHSPLELTGLRKEFCKSARLMGFSTLKTILICSPTELINKNGFSYQWLAELTNFLIEHKLIGTMQPIPGNSRD